MKKPILSLAGLLLLSFSLLQFSPYVGKRFFEKLSDLLEEYHRQLPEEKVYLHFDKPFYKPGDAVWFQAYLADGITNKPSQLSNILYVELLDPKGNLTQKLELAVSDGGAKGDFQFTSDMPGGLYHVRAYTQWMQNFGEESFFEKDIQVQKIINPRLLLSLDFERDGYGAGDEVTAFFEARDLEDQPIRHAEFNYQLQLEGNTLAEGKAETDEQGKADVKVKLPESLSSADGLLNVMINSKGRQESISRAVPIVLQKIDLQFFPEGGDLVNGVESKVAFKAVDEFGKAVDIEGVILDDRQKEVATFSSYHKGMGAFRLKPKKGRNYHARILRPVALETSFQLPAALPNGYSLAVEEREGSLFASVYNPLDKPVYLVGQLHGALIYQRKLEAKKGENLIAIPTEDFPMGIARFTLFDHQELPRAERLSFVNADRKLYVSLEPDKKAYGPREEVQLKIRTYDEHQLPVPASLSLSVVDDKVISYADDKQDHIVSQLLLSSELKGEVEEPVFYFDEEEPKAKQALDYLLMTQGWRRYAWENIFGKEYGISFFPEKAGTVSGRVINFKTGEPVDAEVTLIELTNKKRSAQLRTKEDGSFVFLKADPASPIQLFARGRGVKKQHIDIVLDKDADLFFEQLQSTRSVLEPEVEYMLMAVPNEEAIIEEVSLDIEREPAAGLVSNDFMLQEDVNELSEVVVVGYSGEGVNNLSSSIIRQNGEELNLNQSAFQALQGRVSGVQVVESDGVPGSATNIIIRGSQSISQGSEPLLIVDGFPMEGNNGGISYLSPASVKSISVIKGSEAMALYGSRAVNGVILINTKRGNYRPNYNYQVPDNYASLYIKARKLSEVREFYAPEYSKKDTIAERSDFRETLYWNPRIRTDRRGEASLSFYTSDALTAFRITAEGIGQNGLIGRKEAVITTQQPLSVEATIPPFLLFEDQISLPVLLTNKTDKPLRGQLTIHAPEALQTVELPESNLVIPADSSLTVYYQARVQNLKGDYSLTLEFEGSGYRDKVEQKISVLPKGFPVEVSFSGKDLQKAFSFSIKDPVPGSIDASFTAYTNVLGDLLGGVDGMLREPYGCFEQVSSTTYPNVLALQFIQETRQDNPEVREKALAFIASGYKKLAAYETRQQGFEWYGHTPPHEGLSAYGLLELTEMQKVYSGVDRKLLQRTEKYLLGRKDGRGGFKQNRGKYGFAAAKQEVTDAYIVYAMAGAGTPFAQLEKEYTTTFNEAVKSGDAYRLGLLANAALAFNRNADAEKLLNQIRSLVAKHGLAELPADHSLVRSYGKSLEVEVASLYGMALLRTARPPLADIQPVISYLLESRGYGRFGSTQATILALTTLTEWAKFNRRVEEGGLIALHLNRQPLATFPYEKGHRGDILLASLGDNMQAGRQQLNIAFNNAKEALPYSFVARWTSYTPASSNACKVRLNTELNSPTVKAGETVRMTATLKNISNEGIPQTVAILGIPSGLSLQAWQLKELQEKQIFDYYEIQGNFLILYYREMGPEAEHSIPLDLRAEVPGSFQAPASRAYLYYTDEHKDWAAGEKVEIQP